MGDGPSGPWRKLEDGEESAPLGTYESAPHLFKYALLYQTIAQRSNGTIGPDAVDAWESWQAAAYLGIDLPLPEGAEPGDVNVGRNPVDVVKEKTAYFAALQQAQRDGTPPPEPPPSIRAVQRPVDPAAGVTIMEPMMEVDEGR